MKNKITFEWDDQKEKRNLEKHSVTFFEAQRAFADKKRVILEDLDHSKKEKRYYCIGKVESHILTIRFTYREGNIRIFGAGYWRKGKQIYEKEN